MSDIEPRIKELFDSRNSHETRIVCIENNIEHIREDQKAIRSDIKEYHDSTLIIVRDIQSTVNGFIKDLDGIPLRNSEKLEMIKVENCIPMADKVDKLRKVNWMILGMAALIAVLVGGGILAVFSKWF